MWSARPCLVSFRNAESNRSFWSFLTKSCIKRALYNPPNAFVDACFDLVILINDTPPRTPITVVWNQDLPHYDSTCDGFEDPGYRVAISFLPLADAYVSWTSWRTDSRPWVGTEDITLIIPVGNAIDNSFLSTINKILIDKLSIRSFCY